MNPPPSTASYSYEPFSCYCLHSSSQHALVRCGHPNDRPATHPLSTADDALHRVWCTECVKWCFSKRDDCPVFRNPNMTLGCNGRSGHGGTSKTGAMSRVKACARL